VLPLDYKDKLLIVMLMFHLIILMDHQTQAMDHQTLVTDHQILVTDHQILVMDHQIPVMDQIQVMDQDHHVETVMLVKLNFFKKIFN
jgi:hypothetical protein